MVAARVITGDDRESLSVELLTDSGTNTAGTSRN